MKSRRLRSASTARRGRSSHSALGRRSRGGWRLYASFVGTLVPDAFIITESFTILAMVIVGGMGTLIGPVWGAILLTVLPEVLRGFGDFRLVLYGVALTLAVLFMPGGMMQAAQAFRAQFAFLRSKLGAEGTQ